MSDETTITTNYSVEEVTISGSASSDDVVVYISDKIGPIGPSGVAGPAADTSIFSTKAFSIAMACAL